MALQISHDNKILKISENSGDADKHEINSPSHPQSAQGLLIHPLNSDTNMANNKTHIIWLMCNKTKPLNGHPIKITWP